ncbi:glycoside hydrolase family 43 protein [Collybiopsis luxurians FD-317 M1]|uniref:Arabinan endo-1,5-alpha-L-arabinosidase n=1 Tax=Collybiopsis luxurians FD-317 M1 TaxID=944289 RepID=A0A0D0B8W4_9AGAR|nr:glycoside hydrolase family 43 protein [Collybiopsis luxurians FD-317 M1]
MKSAIIGSLLGILTVVVSATPNPIAGSDTVVVRDPAIWYNSGSKKYFVFSTGNKINIFTSSAITGPWTNVGSVLSSCSVINLSGNCDLWAPDVNFLDGLYTLYYAVSSLGSQNSAIGVATSPSMEPGTWTDLGQVISSKTGDVFNAIDPNIILDPVGLQLTFGSYWNGIYQVGLWPGVNNQASPTPGTHLAGYNGRPAEGGFVYKPASQSYYYGFFSDGITPLVGATSRPPAGQEYKVLVGRGAAGQGPFYDQLGNDITLDLNPPTGTLVLGSHDNVYAPGGQSIFEDPVSGRDVMVYHYVKLSDPVGGPSYLGINYLDFSSGWPVVVA